MKKFIILILVFASVFLVAYRYPDPQYPYPYVPKEESYDRDSYIQNKKRVDERRTEDKIPPSPHGVYIESEEKTRTYSGNVMVTTTTSVQTLYSKTIRGKSVILPGPISFYRDVEVYKFNF